MCGKYNTLPEIVIPSEPFEIPLLLFSSKLSLSVRVLVRYLCATRGFMDGSTDTSGVVDGLEAMSIRNESSKVQTKVAAGTASMRRNSDVATERCGDANEENEGDGSDGQPSVAIGLVDMAGEVLR